MRQFIYLIFLICLFNITSCQIYHKKTSSLDQAINSAEKVRVVFVNGKKIQFDYIVLEEGVIYGVQREKGEIKKVILPEDKIKEIHQKNKGTSAGLSILVGAAVLVGVLTAVYLASPSPYL